MNFNTVGMLREITVGHLSSGWIGRRNSAALGLPVSLAVDLSAGIVLPPVDILPLAPCKPAAVRATVRHDGAVDVLLAIQVPCRLTGIELSRPKPLSDSSLLVIAASVDGVFGQHRRLTMIGCVELAPVQAGGLHVRHLA